MICKEARNLKSLLAVLLLVSLQTIAPAFGATLVSDAQTLAVSATATARQPAAQQFTVSAAASVQVRLRDLGTATGAATGFTKLQAIVTRGGTKVASFSAAGTQQFSAQPGTYSVQVIGTAVSPAGAFDVDVETVPATTALLQFSDSIEAAPPAPNPAQSDLDVPFSVPVAGDYQITLTDRSFPAALTSINLLLFRPGSSSLPLSGPCSASACTLNFTATSSSANYDMLIVATGANPAQAGLYAVSIAAVPSGTVVYSTTQPVGRLPAALPLTLPAGGGFTLGLSDFATPTALTSLRAVVTQGAVSLGSQSGVGSASLTGGSAGAASLFVYRAPVAGAGGAGCYGVAVTQGASVVYRDARPVPEGFDTTNNIGGYRFSFNIPAAGDFRSQLRDLAFPTAFGSLRAVIVQNGNSVQTLMPGSPATATFSGGPAIALVFGAPASSGGNSLAGLSITPVAGGAAALDLAQGVGPLIATRSFDVPVAGSYDLTVDDLLFPDAFAELAVAVTEGSNLTGQIFGGGKITFNAATGPHFVSLLARPSTTAEYSTWGFDVSTTPPAPTLTFTAAATSVTSGGTTTLTWTSANATYCTASGGWTGTKAQSGSETSVALTVDTTFTLTCVGTGGNIIRTANVAVTAAQSGGNNDSGGGRFDVLLLVALVLLLTWQMARRRHLRFQ